MSRLPDNWKDIVATLDGIYSAADLMQMFRLTEGGMWAERRANKEFEDAILPHMHKKAKAIYCGAPNVTIDQRRAEWQEKRKENVTGQRKHMPLIDKENLSVELQVAVTSIVGMHQEDIKHDLKLTELRRWGAIMVLAQTVIDDLKKELRKERSETHAAKVRLHNRISGQKPKVHNSGNGRAD